jgi:hypothetical protein
MARHKKILETSGYVGVDSKPIEVAEPVAAVVEVKPVEAFKDVVFLGTGTHLFHGCKVKFVDGKYSAYKQSIVDLLDKHNFVRA